MVYQKLLEILRGHKVFIQTHNFPDPDAIASAFGMQKFLCYHGIESTICYNGRVDKISVMKMVDNFGIIMYPYDELEIEEKDYVLLVDGQKYNANLTDIPGDEVACIDHHPTVKPCEYLYKDVRQVGACATLVAEYFYQSETPIDKETASALMYGIRMDTDSFGRGVKKLDIKMFDFLFNHAEVALVDRMMNDSIELSDLRAYGAAIENVQIYGTIGIVKIPFDCEDALVAMISDFILKLDAITVSIVYAEKEGGLKFSVRSEEQLVHAGNIASEALKGYGEGGGHCSMAGGYIPKENRIKEKQVESKVLYQRFVDAVEKEHKGRFKAVVFDMDGVIFDSEKLYRRFEKEQGRKYGLPEDKMDLLCERLAGGTKESNKKSFEELMGTDIDYYTYREGVISSMDKFTKENGMELKEGVKELLDFLKERKIKIGLATSTASERAEHHLKAHGLYEYFDEIVYGNMVKNGKPAPDIYLKACEKLGVQPIEAIGVEDSINGVISASTAGLYTCMVVDLIKPNELVKKKASEIFDKIIEIKTLF